MSFPGQPVYDSKMTRESVMSLFDRVNLIWAFAGINWTLLGVEKKISENHALSLFDSIKGKKELKHVLRQISPVLPPIMENRVWKVCLMKTFPVSSWGVYIPESKTVFFAESAGKNMPSAFTLAHEMGHMLGLEHSFEDWNIMNPDSLKKLQDKFDLLFEIKSSPFNETQISRSRKQAEFGPY